MEQPKQRHCWSRVYLCRVKPHYVARKRTRGGLFRCTEKRGWEYRLAKHIKNDVIDNSLVGIYLQICVICDSLWHRQSKTYFSDYDCYRCEHSLAAWGEGRLDRVRRELNLSLGLKFSYPTHKRFYLRSSNALGTL